MTQAAPFAITVCGIEELAGHSEAGATHVLSILDPDHPVPEAFGRFGEHAKLELRFHDIVDARPGEVAPSADHVAAILAFGRALLPRADGPRADLPRANLPRSNLLVHCHAGISRSTAAMTLTLAQAMPDLPAEDVLRLVHGIREKAWPNLRMMELGDAQLGRGGALVRATHALHSRQIVVRPHIGEYMANLGRTREVEAARAAAPL